MSAGRLDAQITVPSGGWAVAVTITAIGGPFTCTIAAGTYFVGTTLLAALQTALDGASGGDGAFTVSASLTDTTGTGLVTIAHATQTITMTWTSTDLRDILGFTGTLTPAALTFTGTKHLRGLWLPDSPVDSEYGGEVGHTETDRTTTVTPTGDVSVTAFGSSRVRMGRTAWSHITRPKARTGAEATTGASYETWLLDTHSGRYSYFATAPQIRVYHDSGGAIVGTYRFIWDGSTQMQRADATWVYLWAITLPPAYEV